MTRLPAPIFIPLQEYQSIETDQLSTEQATYLRDHCQTYLTVERAWSGNGHRLTANHYVGVIVLGDRHIVIQPKTPVTNLFYMLTYAYDLPAFRTEETLLAVGDEIFEFIVTLFLHQVQRLIRQGLYRSYVTHEEDQPYLRGRLLLAEHLRQNVAHLGRFPQRTHDYTANVPENQILTATLGLLTQFGYQDPTLSARLRHTQRAFAEVTLLPVTAADCRQIHYTRLNQRYSTPINLAALLLRHLSLEGGRGQHRFSAYLFNMPEVFEKFVGCYLQEYFRGHPSRTVVLQDHLWLDAERQEKGIPDIVIRHNGQPHCVLDTKYKFFKGNPDPRDRDQMWVYSHRMQVKEGVLVYPVEQLASYQTTFAGIPLRATALPLIGSLAQFKAQCQNFAEQFV